MKIKIDSYDDLPLEKTLHMHIVTILIKSDFNLLTANVPII